MLPLFSIRKNKSTSSPTFVGFFVYRHLGLVVVDKNNYANCYAIFWDLSQAHNPIGGFTNYFY